ncbi:hypothetical protein AC578_4769 [Pseudocercospora eumusae]|uniref:Uncharacterized protein n=1 Tax=Pseudocercospora eumusae TaxID=321146 RepID=A0A139HL56_9PEZI|nr:hypothetical protein AC578_4769 [Pseudocercospora eumusae]
MKNVKQVQPEIVTLDSTKNNSSCPGDTSHDPRSDCRSSKKLPKPFLCASLNFKTESITSMKIFGIILASLTCLTSASIETRLDDSPDAPQTSPPTQPCSSTTPIPCPTTLTVPPIRDCSGCTKTIYSNTNTSSVDCHGCTSLVTSTSFEPWVGLCPACVGGIRTVFNTTGTSTVTSCSATPGPSKK